MYDPTNHKAYGLGLEAVIEVCNHLAYILDAIIFIFYQWLYDIMCDVDSTIHMTNGK